MSLSEPVTTRNLIVDTYTPTTEIFVIDAEGQVVERGIRKLERELPVGLYKIRYRVGDRVTDSLIELPPGQDAFNAPIPQLPIVSAAPSLATGQQGEQAAQFAGALSSGPRVHRGTGASLFVFVNADRQSNSPEPPAKPGTGLSIHEFSGTLLADLAEAQAVGGSSGCILDIDPGQYLLRARLDSGPPIEQTVVVSRGWQTGVYISLIETRMPPPSEPGSQVSQNSTSTWEFDLSQMGVIMVRDNGQATPSVDDIRWTAATRQALGAGRSAPAPDREVMRALLRGKFENPMLGIYAGHLLALQPQPDLELLREVYANLAGLVGPHPDVEALLIALHDPRAQQLAYPEPPMLRASWSLMLSASTAEHDLRPEQSYSTRIAASLWGYGAWLCWRMPSPETASVKRSPNALATLIKEAAAGRLDVRLAALLGRERELSPVERLLASYLVAATKRLHLADELTADEDTGKFPTAIGRYILPVFRRFVDSHLQKQTKENIAGELTPERLSSVSGIPFVALLEAAYTLEQKLGLARAVRPHLFRS